MQVVLICVNTDGQRATVSCSLQYAEACCTRSCVNHIGTLGRPSDTIVFADAAQVNDFQSPASSDHPMLEEFFYVSTNTFEATAHFRHQHFANATFGDGHVDREPPQAGSLDRRLPDRWVGRLRPESLRVP